MEAMERPLALKLQSMDLRLPGSALVEQPRVDAMYEVARTYCVLRASSPGRQAKCKNSRVPRTEATRTNGLLLDSWVFIPARPYIGPGRVTFHPLALVKGLIQFMMTILQLPVSLCKENDTFIISSSEGAAKGKVGNKPHDFNNTLSTTLLPSCGSCAHVPSNECESIGQATSLHL